MNFSPVASIFRGSFLRKVCIGEHHSVFTELIHHLRLEDAPEWGASTVQFFEYFYSILKSEYRCEYIYKNELLKESFLQLNLKKGFFVTEELRVGGSRADLAVIGDSSVCFEIKTELDQPTRLSSQLLDYSKIFDKIYLVVSEHEIEKYTEFSGGPVGLISYADDGFIVVFEARSNRALVSLDDIYNVFRKGELENVLIRNFGGIPNVSTSKYYEACRRKFRKLIPFDAHQEMVTELRGREIHPSKIELLERAPSCLSMAIMGFKSTKKQNLNLIRELENPVYEHLLPIPEREAIRTKRASRASTKNGGKRKHLSNT